MRVLLIGPFPPPYGGVQVHLKAIFDALMSHGDTPLLIASTRTSTISDVPNAFKPRSAISLLYLLLRLNYDVVHLHIGGELTLRLLALTLICGLLPNRKSVVTIHSGGYAREKASSASPYSLESLAFRSVDRLIGVNQQMLDVFARLGVKKSRARLMLPFVINPPVASIELPDTIKNFVEKRNPLLVTVSLLEPEYALPIQIEAMEMILRQHQNAGLLILGSGSQFESVEHVIASKAYRHSLLLAGDVDHESTLRIIEQASVLLRPTYFDGDALSIREALFLGTPVVATDNGMRPPGVDLIPLPPDAESLARKTIEVLDRGTRVSATGSNNGQNNIESVINLYREILGDKCVRKAKGKID